MALHSVAKLRFAQPGHFSVHHMPELGNKPVHDFGYLNRAMEDGAHRCHFTPHNSARYDQIKKREIGPDVEGESVPCYPAADVNPQCGYFPPARPHAGRARTPRGLDA